MGHVYFPNNFQRQIPLSTVIILKKLIIFYCYYRLKLINGQIFENPEQLQAVQQIVGGANPFAPYIVVGPPGKRFYL